MTFLETIIVVVLGSGIIFMGYLIRCKKKLFLIAGYNKNNEDDIKEEDKKVLAKLVGNFSFVVGILLFCLPILVNYFGESIGAKIFIFLIAIGIGYVFYKKPSNC